MERINTASSHRRGCRRELRQMRSQTRSYMAAFSRRPREAINGSKELLRYCLNSSSFLFSRLMTSSKL